MPEERTKGGWKSWRPSKGLWFWSCVGAAALTMIVGFGWGGWVTGGTASKMAKDAAEQARAKLAAAVCVYRFTNAPDAQAQLAALEKEDTWLRSDFIEKGGWTTLAGMSKPVPEAADICAQKLLEAAAAEPEKTQS